MNRLPFLDWTRGLAVLIMIQCHTFNCLTRPDLRQGSAYVFTQFVGGMAAVLFLFLAGITFAFQMERLDRRAAPIGTRMKALLRRAGYILLLAYLFRISNSLMSLPHPAWKVLLKVDILNCMGAAMLLLIPAALWTAAARARVATLTGVAIALAAPLISAADWSGVPAGIRDYLVPQRSTFALFPWASYLAFGVAAGAILRRTAEDRAERLMQWFVLVGFGLVVSGQYFSNLPYSLYTKSEFWLDSPALVFIRLGLLLLTLAGAFLWTEFLAPQGWSWVQTLGKTSLMVYWVHVLLVYGWLTDPWKNELSILPTTAVTVLVVGLMVALAVLRLRWSARESVRPAMIRTAANPS